MTLTPAQRQSLSWLLIAAAALVAVWALAPVLMPFLLGAGLAYALHPAVERLAARRVPRVLAITLVVLTTVLVVLAVTLLVVPILAKELPMVKVFTGPAIFIPYLGFGLGLLLALLAGILQFTGWYGVIVVAVVYGVGQVIESFFLTPAAGRRAHRAAAAGGDLCAAGLRAPVRLRRRADRAALVGAGAGRRASRDGRLSRQRPVPAMNDGP